MAPHTSLKPKLLLHNLLNFGHFLTYATAFTRWGISRGFEVHLLGRGLNDTTFHRRFANHPAVVIHDASPSERLDQLRADWAKPRLLQQDLNTILEAQRDLAPRASVLLATDDYIFEGIGITEPGFRFETPTCGLTTFGHRQQYTGYIDAHAVALNRMIDSRAPFSAIFSLDEYQAIDTGSDQNYLIFLPDIFSETTPGPGAPDNLEVPSPFAAALKAFLDRAPGSVFPIIGKFDQRKNNLWVLETAATVPDASCVVLGERVPYADDPRIDALLARLRTEGRLYEHWGFVPEDLFHAVLAHGRVPFLPLPYSCHYGSSGIQLLGLAHGKPCLAPTGGLMARRIEEHGLGMVFRAGDRKDFERRFRRLLKCDPEPFQKNARRFMACFSESARQEQMDRAFGLPLRENAIPATKSMAIAQQRHGQSVHGAFRFFWKGRRREALAILQGLLRRAPKDAGLHFRAAMILLGLDRLEEAREAIRVCLELGVTEELDFFLRQQVQAAGRRLDANDRSGAVQRVDRILELLPLEYRSGKTRTALSASTWRQIGSVLARAGAHDRSVECFRAALCIDPGAHDVRLNLSDVLRYACLFEESLRELDALESAAPGWPGLWHKRGQVFYASGMHEKALSFFTREPKNSGHYEAARACIAEIKQLKQ